MAEEKKQVKKTTAKKTSATAKKRTAKKTTSTRKQPIKKENTILFEGLGEEVTEFVTKADLKEENKELKSDIKKYKVLIILLIVLILISVLAQALRVYSEYLEETQDTKISTIHSETLALDDEEVKKLYATVSMFKYVNAGNFMGYFYEIPGATVDSIPDEVKVYMGLSLENVKKHLKNNTLTIKKEEVRKNVESIFGKDIKYKDKSLGSDNLCYLSLATFNNKENRYEVENYNQCHSSYESYYGTKLVDAQKYSNRIELTEKVYYGEYEEENDKMQFNIYKQADKATKNNLIATVDTINLNESRIIEEYEDLLNSYKYTFYLEKGKYYLNSVERIVE